ncbi:hypothetical protein ACLESD_13020 [Pyxidicoccus sp. 3LFB2]
MDESKGKAGTTVAVPGMLGPTSELQRLLKGTEITVADVRTAVAVLAATARGKTGHAVSQAGAGVGISAPAPLASGEDVQQLAQRLDSVEARRQETNEKLDKVLVALGSK